MPHALQAEVHRKLKRFGVVIAHRRFGKTVLAVNELVDRAVQDESGTGRYGYVAPYLRQAKEVAWSYVKMFTQHLPGVSIHEGELIVTLGNGSRIRLYGADNPDAMRGTYFDFVVIDEVADLRPHVWGEIIRPALADRRGGALFIGTPKGQNLLSELFHAEDSDGWLRAIYRVDETGIIPEDELVLARAAMSQAQYDQEFLCSFSASSDNVLITIDQASEAARRAYGPSQVSYAPVVLGVDVARFGGDRSCIARRQGIGAFDLITMQGADTMTLAARVMSQIDEHKPDAVFIDASPASYGVIDFLRKMERPVIEVNFGGTPSSPQYADKRSEMWDELAKWLRGGGAIPNDSELKTDLCGPTYAYTLGAGKFQLERKDDMKKRGIRSPDLGDALALTFAYPVVARTLEHSTSRVARGADYHPMDRMSL